MFLPQSCVRSQTPAASFLLVWQLGAFSAKSVGDNQYEDGELTFLGRVLAHLPVDPRLGRMVVLGHVFGCLDECLIIGQCPKRKKAVYERDSDANGFSARQRPPTP